MKVKSLSIVTFFAFNFYSVAYGAEPKCVSISKLGAGQGPSCFLYEDGTKDKKCKSGLWARTCPEDQNPQRNNEPKCISPSKLRADQGPSCLLYDDGSKDKKCSNGWWSRTCPEDKPTSSSSDTTS